MYHYTGCGLPYVWLIDGYKERDAQHGVAIQYLDGLHCAIGREITFTGRPLSGEEIRFIRAGLDWSQRKLAEALGVKEATVRAWKERAAALRGDGPARNAPIRIDAETGIGTPVSAVSRE